MNGFGWRVVLDRRLKGPRATRPGYCKDRRGPDTGLPTKGPAPPSLSLFDAACHAVAGQKSEAVIEVFFDHPGRV